MSKCFISTLRKLKMSSKEAVEAGGILSPFSKYMHIEREEFEERFISIIDKAMDSKKAQLVLLCGSAGDGKTHLISYIKDKIPAIDNVFDIYNDATESYSPRKNAEQTLGEKLSEFKDDNINNSNKKMILAINLGTLTNFIDSIHSEGFDQLKDYIKTKKILDQEIMEDKYNENSYFQSINFSDYHMFSLSKDGPRSKYMKNLFNKIFTHKQGTLFRDEYLNTCCNNCEGANRCPIKENYENLMDEQLQDNMIQLLIEVMIKNKIMISTRELLNLIYDILVHIRLDNISDDNIVKKVKKLSFFEYLTYLLPNIIYENRDVSNIIQAISSNDPLNIRNEKIDELIIKLNNTSHIGQHFAEDIKYNKLHYYYEVLVADKELKIINDEKLTEADRQAKIKQIIIFYIRVMKLLPKQKDIIFEDDIYRKYMMSLYYFNIGDKEEMKKLLEVVKSSIYSWNSINLKEEQIQISIGKRQNKFKIYEDLRIRGVLPEETYKDGQLNKFLKVLNVKYQVADKMKGQDVEHSVDIDYALYKLINDIKDGYRPNKKDKNNFINFVDFVHRLQQYGSHNERVMIDVKIGEKVKSYKFQKNEYNEYCLVEM